MISVLICTYNRGSLIGGTLHSLINRQIIIPDEIIVVNGGGKNDCKIILENWKNSFKNLKIIETENINLASSRNIGLKYCLGDIILLTDDDARPLPDWTLKIVEAHKKFPNAGAIGGNVINKNEITFRSRVADIATFPKNSSFTKVRTVPGVNCSYKKEVVEMVGEYDINLFRGEDVDYNWRVIKKGWDVYHIPEIIVNHIGRPTFYGLLYQHYMYGRAHYLVRTKWPDMYSHYPLKIDSISSVIKYIVSWTFIPVYDALDKTNKLNDEPNGFEFFVFLLINIFNRIGSFTQRFFY